MNQDYQKALTYLRKMLGEKAVFRDGQWETIDMIANRKKKALLVQRTGWGKSLVYFLATKLLREQDSGPTLLISPLLSLMRNQITMAERIGVAAETINCENLDQWKQVENNLMTDKCDILLVSPERLNNENFQRALLPVISAKVGLLVVDEAHCISDWGHDFRPDYRRIIRIIHYLPKGVPVLGTTATANNRVVEDIKSQLGDDLLVIRGPLVRTSLRLQNITIRSRADRLAWLAQNINKFPGSGIIYCLTVHDTKLVAGWLQKNNIEAVAYYGGVENREELECGLQKNEFKALVATVALGMGFDKPDLGFVIHFQRPGSVIAYYQQVGRAGRALDRSYGILLNGDEDDEIQEYFIKTAFPPIAVTQDIVSALEKSEGMTINQLLSKVNVSFSMAEKALKLLEIESVVQKEKDKYYRTANPWRPDIERIEKVTLQRELELQQMKDYVGYSGCLMEFLERALDDIWPKPCGICSNCKKKGLSAEVHEHLHVKACDYISNWPVEIKPKTRLPVGVLLEGRGVSLRDLKIKPGRALCYYGDSGWGKLVQKGKYEDNYFSDKLVGASADLIVNKWNFDAKAPKWITAIPSRRRPELVYNFAGRLGKVLNLPFVPVFDRFAEAPEQKGMQNSAMQARNVLNSLKIIKEPLADPVLLVDDIRDSGWTLTIAGKLLVESGCEIVFPFTLASTSKG